MSRPPIRFERPTRALRVGSRLGKYRLDRRVGAGAYATVYAATDLLLGIRAALKVPIVSAMTTDLMEELRREVRLTMRLDHANILTIRDADFIEGHFVIVSPLAERTLEDRLQKRMSFETGHDIVTQLLEGVAHAHEHGVIHCDIKPANVLMFEGNQIRLADFGIAKAARRTVDGSGTGTIGHMAPEQAMGKPSARSDVFAIGLIAYRIFSGVWPEYPFQWPMDGAARLRRRVHPDLVDLIRKSIEMKPRQRYRDATQMLAQWDKLRLRSIRFVKRQRGD